MEQLVKAYYDKARGWRLFMPDGTEVPALCRTSVTVDDNWDDKPMPSFRVEGFCEVINEIPIPNELASIKRTDQTVRE